MSVPVSLVLRSASLRYTLCLFTSGCRCTLNALYILSHPNTTLNAASQFLGVADGILYHVFFSVATACWKRLMCDSRGFLPGPPLVFPMIWIKALFSWKKTKSKNTYYFCACGLCRIKWNIYLLHLYLGQSLVSMVAMKKKKTYRLLQSSHYG